MGALHDGHLRLVRESALNTDHTVVSIFVNPRQFNNPEDLKKYPKLLHQDLEKLFYAGAKIVFIPNEMQVYGEGESPETDLQGLNSRFEGAFRPGHFRGVTNVLYRFFRLIAPDHVYFGLKDLQQCMVVEKLVQQHFPAIVQHNLPTEREPGGLAMSSRNIRLSADGLKKASAIYKELAILASAHGNVSELLIAGVAHLLESGIETEYLDLVNLPEMESASGMVTGKRQAVIFAGYLEGVRLIDNLLLSN